MKSGNREAAYLFKHVLEREKKVGEAQKPQSEQFPFCRFLPRFLLHYEVDKEHNLSGSLIHHHWCLLINFTLPKQKQTHHTRSNCFSMVSGLALMAILCSRVPILDHPGSIQGSRQVIGINRETFGHKTCTIDPQWGWDSPVKEICSLIGTSLVK